MLLYSIKKILKKYKLNKQVIETYCGVGRITGRLSPKVCHAGGLGYTHSRAPLTPCSFSVAQGLGAHAGP